MVPGFVALQWPWLASFYVRWSVQHCHNWFLFGPVQNFMSLETSRKQPHSQEDQMWLSGCGQIVARSELRDSQNLTLQCTAVLSCHFMTQCATFYYCSCVPMCPRPPSVHNHIFRCNGDNYWICHLFAWIIRWMGGCNRPSRIREVCRLNSVLQFIFSGAW